MFTEVVTEQYLTNNNGRRILTQFRDPSGNIGAQLVDVVEGRVGMAATDGGEVAALAVGNLGFDYLHQLERCPTRPIYPLDPENLIAL